MTVRRRDSSHGFSPLSVRDVGMIASIRVVAGLAFFFASAALQADPPVVSYLFPAGGQRGTVVPLHVGGLNLYRSCSFELLGQGVQASPTLRRTGTVWFEGPLVPLPESQQPEDYPKDMAGTVRIASDAALGIRYAHAWTAQGAAPALKFMVGDLPEIVEQEQDGDPVPADVRLPVTINGRIFPRENADVWRFTARKGQTVACEVCAARLGSPLDSRLEVYDPTGRRIAENDDYFGVDSFVRFTAPTNGQYRVHIHDTDFRGGPAFVYRLTLTADPWVDRVYPLGGRRGAKVEFQPLGQALPPGPVPIHLPTTGEVCTQRLSVGGKKSNPFLLDLGDLPEYLEKEPNDTLTAAQQIHLPAVLNGRIDRHGDADCWAFDAKNGDVYDFELYAGRLGSPLDPVLCLLDHQGKELARVETRSAGSSDRLLHWSAPVSGKFVVRITDRFPSRGGPTFAYRLRIGPSPAPDFRLRLPADVLTVERKGQVKLPITVERRGGLMEPIALKVRGLGPGLHAARAVVPANQATAEIVIHADANAVIQASHLVIEGQTERAGKTLRRRATVPAARGEAEIDRVLLAVALPTPFKIIGHYELHGAPRGTVFHRRYHIDRHGFSGPIEICTADRQARHLQGALGPTITVPPGVNDFDYPLWLPPWMETGRTCRVVVEGVGMVDTGDGVQHAVSYSSATQDDQIIAVIEPGRLGIEADRHSIAATPGTEVRLAVFVRRGEGLRGPVKIEAIVPRHIHSVSAGAVQLSASQDQASLPIRFGSLPGPFNMPLDLRATLLDHGEPVVAEMKIVLRPVPRH